MRDWFTVLCSGNVGKQDKENVTVREERSKKNYDLYIKYKKERSVRFCTSKKNLNVRYFPVGEQNALS